MSSIDRIRGVALSLPPRSNRHIDFVKLSDYGMEFCEDYISTKLFSDRLNTKSINFRYIWVRGIKFLIAHGRDQTPGKWERKAYLSYGQDPAKGNLIYGTTLVFGWDARNNCMRSLDELEKDVLWGCAKCISVNYGTADSPDIQIVFRLCYVEDHPTDDSPFAVDTTTDEIPDGEAILGPV